MDLFLMLGADPYGQGVVDCNNLIGIINVVESLILVLRIVVPIILLVLGAIDLAKAVIAGDDKEAKQATSRLLKRAIAAVAIFFIVSIMNLIMGVVGSKDWQHCWNTDATEKPDEIVVKR